MTVTNPVNHNINQKHKEKNCLTKSYSDKNSFKGQIVIDKNKTGFQSVVLLPINLYLKDDFLTSF